MNKVIKVIRSRAYSRLLRLFDDKFFVKDYLKNRELIGLKKYGCTVDRVDLTFHEWVEHSIEEQFDNLVYLIKICEENSKWWIFFYLQLFLTKLFIACIPRDTYKKIFVSENVQRRRLENEDILGFDESRIYRTIDKKEGEK